MLYLFFYNPHKLGSFDYEKLYMTSTMQNTFYHQILSQGRAPVHNRYGRTNPSTIIIKPRNIITIELDNTYRPLVNYIAILLMSYHKQGILHTFDLSNHPELLI